MTNPDINVKLVRGKCQSVRFSLTVRDYKYFSFFVLCMGNIFSRVMLEINLITNDQQPKIAVEDQKYLRSSVELVLYW